MRVTREQAIEIVGLEAVERVSAINCDFTNRVTAGTCDAGYTEFSAETVLLDSYYEKLVAYYYQDENECTACDQFDNLNWEISHYELI